MDFKSFFRDQGPRFRTATYALLLLGMLAAIVSTSFAWFSISRSPMINDMEIYVNAPPGVQIAVRADAPDEQWGEHISFSDLISENSPLRPVTWSDAEQCFKGIRYGLDGRQTHRWRTLSDAENANTQGNDQFYVVGSFYARTGSACTLSLAEAMTMSNGEQGAGTYVIGAPEWNEQLLRHTDAGAGAQYAVRIGFRVTPLNAEVEPPEEDPEAQTRETSRFIIYEPNADRHQDGTIQIIETASIDGTAELVSADRLIRQTASTWAEAEPPERDVTVKTLGAFTTPTDVLTLEPGEIARIDLYIWVEGQDVDCYSIPEDAVLFANIQFEADYTGQSGLVEIPDEEEVETKED